MCWGKNSKERITVALCASMTGEKLKPLVIGKSKSPRCFGRINTKSLPVHYYYNKKAWMTSYIFEDFVKLLNRQMKAQNRHILLFVDNAPSHPSGTFSNVKLQFLPPNTTSYTQPMDMGIIQATKLKFRKRQMMNIVKEMDKNPTLNGTELLKQITILDAIYWLRSSWQEVEQTTIQKCFIKSGFTNGPTIENAPDDTDVNEEVDEEEDIPLQAIKLSQDLFGCSFTDLVEIDMQFRTCETDSVDWEQPVDVLLNNFNTDTQNESDSDSDSDCETNESVTVPTTAEACGLISKLKLYAKHNGHAELLNLATQIDDVMLDLAVKKPKQTKLSQFFEKSYRRRDLTRQSRPSGKVNRLIVQG